jgi:branched-chain amino acid aminotransferase
MFTAEFQGGRWGRGELQPYGPIEILPAACALQYAEVVSEGLKAYCVGAASWPNLFRPEENWRRLMRSALRLAMQPVPQELFLQGVDAVAGASHAVVPRRSGQALYLRPFLFGTEPTYQLRKSTSFRFMVIASPVEIYSTQPMRVAIERRDVRAAIGGVGTAMAAARGHPMTLWLDANEHRWLQELSGMNIFAVIRGELHTPELDGAILAGITRDSLLTLGRHLGFVVHERRIALDEILAQIASGECSEVFACGTAAIVSPIGVLAELRGEEYIPRRIDDVASRLRTELLAIQECRAPDPFGWIRSVAPFRMPGGDAAYHAHIYYVSEDRGRAEALRDRLFELQRSGAAPQLLFIGELRDRKVGPHPLPQYEIHFTAVLLPLITGILRDSGLRVLVHPLTDDDLADHTRLGTWIGTPIDLDISVLDPPGCNQGIARFGKTDF